VQEANPDLVIWPGREVITYFGHAIVLGETPNAVDWRHGAPGVSLRDIEDASVADGALFGVAHPTIFPTPVFASFCRGCELTIGDTLDWDEVTTLEVLTSSILVDDSELGGPGLGVQVQQPFVLTALELWQRLLREGHKITAVSGSDDKLGPDYGTSVTAVYAEQLSQEGLAAGLRAGHAYVRTRGAFDSPTVEVAASTADGQHGIVGDTLHADAATLDVHVRGGDGQLLFVSKDGLPAGVVPIVGDDFRTSIAATRDAGSGPLGTFWRVDTADLQSLTTIGNPVFLQGGPPPADPPPAAAQGDGGRSIPVTGAPAAPVAALLVGLLGSLAAIRALGRLRTQYGPRHGR
jgi:hypothetical protein